MLKIYDLFLSFMTLRIILVTIFVIDARIFGQKLPRMPKVHKSSWESSQLLLSSELRSGAVAPKRLARYVSMPVLCCTFLRHLPPATVCSSLPPPLLLNVNVSLHSDLKIAPIYLIQYFKIRFFHYLRAWILSPQDSFNKIIKMFLNDPPIHLPMIWFMF